MSSDNPFDAMMRQTQEMMKSFPAMEAFRPDQMEKLIPAMPPAMMEMLFGNALNTGGLDASTRLYLTLAGLTMQGAVNEVALRQTVRHLSEAGASDQQIYEAIGQMAVFSGLPASTKAMELARDVLEKEEGA